MLLLWAEVCNIYFYEATLVDPKVLQIMEMVYDSVITTVKFYKGTLKNVQMFPRQCDDKEIALNTFSVVTIIIITIDGINYHVITCFNIKTNIDRQ